MDNITKKFLRRSKGHKPVIDYNKIAKELKGKTTFKVDLRKVNTKKKTNTFNFGERMNLLKAARNYSRYKEKGRLITIPRLKKESKTAYKKRLRNTKNDYGQESNLIKGVFIDAPVTDKVKLNRFTDENGITSTEIKTSGMTHKGNLYSEIIIPIDVFDIFDNTENTIKNIYENNKFDEIYPDHRGFRSNGFGSSDSDMWALIAHINDWMNKYKADNNWLTGFILRTYGED